MNEESTAVPAFRSQTREEWLAARSKLLQEEKEHTRRADELAQKRQELPWVRVEKGYRSTPTTGVRCYRTSFRGRSQLLVYHLMFGAGLHRGLPLLLGDRRWI